MKQEYLKLVRSLAHYKLTPQASLYLQLKAKGECHMFLNHETIDNTFVKEGFGLNGEREAVLVVKMNTQPDMLKTSRPKDYEELSERLSYLDNLAKNGFLDFNRIEVVSGETQH